MMGDWTMMAGYGAAHWIMFVVVAVLVLYPTGRILSRLGLSPFWSLLAFVPILNLIGLWFLAFIDWPGQERPTSS